MKKTLALFALASCAALTSLADWKPPKDYQKMTKGKRVCVKVETITIDGKKHWVKYYQRDGRPDWIRPPVETNAVKNLEGKEQYNPLQHDAEELRDIENLAAKASKKDSKTFEKECKNLEKARDKSESQEFKDLYQRTLDIWKAKVNGGK